MPPPDALVEFRDTWLPHATTGGILRLMELLQKESPFLIHGQFTKAPPVGCLASHIAWWHPETTQMEEDAGIVWLTRIAGLNPATSKMLVRWDDGGAMDRNFRREILDACRDEIHQRSLAESKSAPDESDPSLVANVG